MKYKQYQEMIGAVSKQEMIVAVSKAFRFHPRIFCDTLIFMKRANFVPASEEHISRKFTPSNSDEEVKEVKPRKKAGRKQSSAPAGSKRVAQNRIAQR